MPSSIGEGVCCEAFCFMHYLVCGKNDYTCNFRQALVLIASLWTLQFISVVCLTHTYWFLMWCKYPPCIFCLLMICSALSKQRWPQLQVFNSRYTPQTSEAACTLQTQIHLHKRIAMVKWDQQHWIYPALCWHIGLHRLGSTPSQRDMSMCLPKDGRVCIMRVFAWWVHLRLLPDSTLGHKFYSFFMLNLIWFIYPPG